jgi:hypothetical protein
MPPMQYWEIVADKLSAAAWAWGYCGVVTEDAHISPTLIIDKIMEARHYVLGMLVTTRSSNDKLLLAL